MLRNELGKHLAGLQHEGVLIPWHDGKIQPGHDWRMEIESRLREADVVLLLISADFLSSEFCNSVELAEAMQRSDRGGAAVIPIILRPADWSGAPFARLQVLPAGGRPVTMFADADEVFADVARSIRQRLAGRVPPPTHRMVTVRGMEFVHIAEGDFTMGTSDEQFRRLALNDPDAMARENPQHVVYLPSFWIGRNPVTNKQYQEFLAIDRARPVPFRDDGFSAPFNWSGSNRSGPAGMDDHPVVLVSWHDARVFCDWIGGRLPTEAEWERAARGTDARIWPWGNLWQSWRCNTVESENARPTRVGAFSPQGDSVFGVADMSGNVWEWCSSLFDAYPYDANSGREEAGPGERVIRGGCWNLDRYKARCAYRGGTSPNDSGFTIGFRVALDEIPDANA